jgi:serine/threonine-protein kinase RsbW
MADADKVILTVPARSEFARTVRVAAAELATRADMDLDSVEDVRLAVEEAFVFASERAVAPELTFTFDVAPGMIGLDVAPLASGCDEEGPDAGERYSRFILESICDEFELSETGGICRLRLVMRTA